MKANNKTTVKYEVTMTLTEIEARALKELTGYGLKEFLRVFYSQLGRSYLEPYEAGVRSLFDSIPSQIGPELKIIDNMRHLIEKQSKS